MVGTSDMPFVREYVNIRGANGYFNCSKATFCLLQWCIRLEMINLGSQSGNRKEIRAFVVFWPLMSDKAMRESFPPPTAPC